MAGFAARTGARIPRILVHREIIDRWIVVKDSLSSVAVMNVPIDNRHTLDFLVTGLRIPSGDCHVIEKTKTHRPIGRGMMAWRTHGHKGRRRLAFHERVDRAAGRSRATQSRFE